MRPKRTPLKNLVTTGCSFFLVLLLGCQSEDDSVPVISTDEKIQKVTICCDSEGESTVFSFEYDEDKLYAVHLNDHVLAKYVYDNDVLTELQFIGNESGNLSRSFAYTYDGNKVKSVLRSDTDRLPGFRLNTVLREYEHHTDGSIIRYDRDTFYNVTPPIISVRQHEVKPNYQRSSLLKIQDNDTLQDVTQQSEIILDNSFPNPLLRLDLPIGFNEYALLPFVLTNYTIQVAEVFYQSPHLPYQITRSTDGSLWLTTKYKYTVQDDQLVEIQITVNDLISSVLSTTVATIEWN